MRRRSRFIVVGVLLTLIAAGAIAWRWSWHRGAVEPPPRLPDPQRVDPLVAAAVERAWLEADRQPGSAAARLKLAMTYDANALPDLAMASYEQALQLDEDSAKAWYHLGMLRVDAGDGAGALEAFERASQMNPAYGPAQWRIGLIHLDAGRLVEAEAAFTRADAIDARDPGGRVGLARVAIQRGDPARAEAMLRTVLQMYPSFAYARLLLGGALRDLGRLDEARVELARGSTSQTINNDPWRFELNRLRTGHRAIVEEAQRLIDGGSPAEAIPMLEELRVGNPMDVEVIVSLSAAYLESGRVDNGLDVLLAAERRGIEHFGIHLNASRAYELKKDVVRAQQHAERAIALNPGLGAAYVQRARMMLQTRADQALAIQPLEQALLRGGPNREASLLLGQIHITLNHWKEARRVFEDASRHHPDEALVWVGLAAAGAELGELDDAEAAWRRASDLKPLDPAVAATGRRINQLRAASPTGGQNP